MEKAFPYLGMVVSQFAQVGLFIMSKEAILSGMSTFTFAFYSSSISSFILLPSSFLLYRSTRPPLCWDFFWSCFLVGLLGLLMQVFGMTGILYASASLSTAMLNLIPGFTFLFAVLFRMEVLDFRSFSSLAKTIGTVVAISGAIVATFYEGPILLMIPSSPNLAVQSLNPSSNWVLGGILLGICSFLSSMFIIAQAFVLKKYPVELIIMFSYSCFVAILSAAASLIIDKDFSTWSLNSKTRLLAVIYAGLFGNVFQVTIGAWVVRKKGPFFAATFHPLGIVIATTVGVIFLHDIFYLGSLIGSVIIVIGFYAVMWGKNKERKLIDNTVVSCLESGNEKSPLLVYTKKEKLRLRFPLSNFLQNFLARYEVHLSQLTPNAISRVLGYELLCKALKLQTSFEDFAFFFRFIRIGDRYTVSHRVGVPVIVRGLPNRVKEWRTRFFYIDRKIVTSSMVWRDKEKPIKDISLVSGGNDPAIVELGKHSVFGRILPEAALIHAGMSHLGKKDKKPKPKLIGSDWLEKDLISFLDDKGLNAIGDETRAAWKCKASAIKPTKIPSGKKRKASLPLNSQEALRQALAAAQEEGKEYELLIAELSTESKQTKGKIAKLEKQVAVLKENHSRLLLEGVPYLQEVVKPLKESCRNFERSEAAEFYHGEYFRDTSLQKMPMYNADAKMSVMMANLSFLKATHEFHQRFSSKPDNPVAELLEIVPKSCHSGGDKQPTLIKVPFEDNEDSEGSTSRQ
ncbi:OLC1v1028206C1 [Oldenlandia corymbosa var. corymbosa]|uniref:OLC1v1028206C1 n=1 Tax=Oldenlandia corymbosa var. corymbosa TaxID=529605 RepID=A0AAV1CDZ9_OLDCO|nr:OLC1v1028206C1 [Oldenlandia corymbosa var. corymbosa]